MRLACDALREGQPVEIEVGKIAHLPIHEELGDSAKSGLADAAAREQIALAIGQRVEIDERG